MLREVTGLISKEYSFDKDPLKIKVEGIGSFGDRVVYANIKEKEQLNNIAGIIIIIITHLDHEIHP